MLGLVLAAAVVGFGMLLIASLSGTTAWAWVAVAVSVVGAAILVADWRRQTAASGQNEPALPVPNPARLAEAPAIAFPPTYSHNEPVSDAAQPSQGMTKPGSTDE